MGIDLLECQGPLMHEWGVRLSRYQRDERSNTREVVFVRHLQYQRGIGFRYTGMLEAEDALIRYDIWAITREFLPHYNALLLFEDRIGMGYISNVCR